MTKVLYKPLSLLVSALGGVLASLAFKQLWKRATGEEDSPSATDREYSWREVVLAAAVQGAVCGEGGNGSGRRHRIPQGDRGLAGLSSIVTDSRTLRRYRRACDYLAAAMIYLRDNLAARTTAPGTSQTAAARSLGHLCRAQSRLWRAQWARASYRTARRTLLLTGPGHGAPAIHANLWLDGTHARNTTRR
jgi:hypothetical protein